MLTARASTSAPASTCPSCKERDAGEGMHHSRMWHAAFEQVQFGRGAGGRGAARRGGRRRPRAGGACHIRVAERATFYALPEGSRGIFVGGGGSVRIPRLIGVARMADMMLTGRVYDAEEGERVGFSQYLVADGEGLAKAIELRQAHRRQRAADQLRA